LLHMYIIFLPFCIFSFTFFICSLKFRFLSTTIPRYTYLSLYWYPLKDPLSYFLAFF
jgi:hypothetical protein